MNNIISKACLGVLYKLWYAYGNCRMEKKTSYVFSFIGCLEDGYIWLVGEEGEEKRLP